jgi:hypothetical protein
MADLSYDQLRQLCAALGWQGGTFHQVLAALQQRDWQPISTAPKEHGAQVLGWFRKVKLDEDDNLTDEVIGGAIAQVSRNGDGWDEPDWLNASGAYFFDDFSFEPEPVLWQPLPQEPKDSALSAARSYLASPEAGEPSEEARDAAVRGAAVHGEGQQK